MTAKEKRQQKALVALMACKTRAEAAKTAGISLSTIRDYLADPTFREQLDSMLNEATDEAQRAAVGELLKSFRVLAAIRDDKSVSPTDRIRAAGKIIDSALRMRARYFEQAADDVDCEDTQAYFEAAGLGGDRHEER